MGPAAVSGSVIAGSASAVQVLPENTVRTKIVLSSDSANEAWYIRLGGTATTSDYTYRVQASGNLVLEAPMHTGSVSAIQGVADGNLMVTEFGPPLRGSY